MENKRINKEYSLIDDEVLKSIIGTTNKHNPKIIYVRTKTKIKPCFDKKDYSEDIIYIKNKLKAYLRNIIGKDNTFNKNHILNFYIGENSISYNKKSNIKYDIFLKPNLVKDLALQETYVRTLIESFNNEMNRLFKEKNMVCYQ